MKQRTAYAVLKAPRHIKLEEDHRFIIWVAMCVHCDVNADWFGKFGDQAVNHFGRIHEPKKLAPENAWVKNYGQYDHTNSRWNYIIENRLLGERRPITAEQYDDDSFTLNTR